MKRLLLSLMVLFSASLSQAAIIPRGVLLYLDLEGVQFGASQNNLFTITDQPIPYSHTFVESDLNKVFTIKGGSRSSLRSYVTNNDPAKTLTLNYGNSGDTFIIEDEVEVEYVTRLPGASSALDFYEVGNITVQLIVDDPNDQTPITWEEGWTGTVQVAFYQRIPEPASWVLLGIPLIIVKRIRRLQSGV